MPAAAPIVYRKLPGRGASGMEYHRLYQAPDHLLLVASTGFTETYRRFYFRDIQAVVVRKTILGAIQNGVIGFLAGICALGMAAGAATGFTLGWMLGWGIPLLFFLGLLGWNIARGPTCVCDVRTAVQVRRVGSVGRVRTARRLLERLRPLIDAAQGAMPPEEFRQRLDQARVAEAAAPPVIGGRTW